jgi:hypothetical protein
MAGDSREFPFQFLFTFANFSLHIEPLLRLAAVSGFIWVCNFYLSFNLLCREWLVLLLAAATAVRASAYA